MLYEYYKAIKTAVKEIEGQNGIEWFNNQYEGIIHQDRVVYIEFPDPLLPVPLSKDMERTELKIRLHVVSRALQRIDSAIPDSEVQEHEILAQSIRDALRFTCLKDDNSNAITSKLRWSGWQHHHKYQGWMVTWIDFECHTKAI